MEIKEIYKSWLENAGEDQDLIEELKAMNDDEIYESFYRELKFGTAGLRGIIGAGTNRMNIYTVRKATQGLANFLNKKYDAPSVAISFDSRIKGFLFAKEAARVLAANGVKAYISTELQPTPVVSYAVRELKASAGIMVTASHNPAKYNGYKCYGSDGCQMTICRGSGLKVVYTPLNGAGNKLVRKILGRIGVENVVVVPEQENPDGNFTTCPYPNPEIKEALAVGLKLCEKEQADLLLATDPDSDRVGIAVKTADGYRLMTGNETGIMLLNYILSCRKAAGTLPENPVAVKTVVTSKLVDRVCEKYGCELRVVLTGFKYIGEQILLLEQKNEENRYVFGFEESYGYLAGSYVRDKDAVVASMLICEMAAYYRQQGKSLDEVMTSIYKEYGHYLNRTESFEFDGAAGMQKMSSIMDQLRSEPPVSVYGSKVTELADYLNSYCRDIQSGETYEIKLPKSNVLSYSLDDGGAVIVRPSGTEPKIKIYATSVGTSNEDAAQKADIIFAYMTGYMRI